MSTVKSGTRTALYVIGNICFLIATVMLGTYSGTSPGELAYLLALFALCSAPLLFLAELNGPYVLLAIFLAVYFVFFGALDFLTLLSGGTIAGDAGFMSPAETGLVTGAALALGGYIVGARLGKPGQTRAAMGDWTQATVVLVGAALWLLGSAAILYYQVILVPVKSNAATDRGLAALGPALTFIVMLGQLIEPLGVLILAYGYARYRTLSWRILILAVVLAQVAVGFVCDIKSQAMLGGILVILAKTLMDNKLPKLWLAAGVMFLILVFPLFQAYRAEITGERGLTRAQAVENISKVLEIVLASREKAREGGSAQHTATFFERASLKGNVELAFAHTGIDTPFQNGRTLVSMLTAFIPRLIWPDKPDVAVGQEFNKVFVHSVDPDTYISPSHLGELYWNFGWPGIIIGMTLIGMLLGFIGAKCSLAEGQSVTRLLILLATAHKVCLGFEGSIAIAYVVWARSLAAIGVLHLLLARPSAAQSTDATRDSATPGAVTAASTAPRFPNLLT